MLRAAQFVDDLQRALDWFEDSVERRDLVHRSVETALGRRAIVAEDVDDERVVGVGERRHCVQDAPHLVIDVRAETGEHFHHPGVEPLLIGFQ